MEVDIDAGILEETDVGEGAMGIFYKAQRFSTGLRVGLIINFTEPSSSFPVAMSEPDAHSRTSIVFRFRKSADCHELP